LTEIFSSTISTHCRFTVSKVAPVVASPQFEVDRIDFRGSWSIMGNYTVVFTREQLFEEAWNMPMTALAKKYGLSDVGLRKICKRLQVPLPPQGYHLRSRKCLKPPLPPAPKGTPLSYTAYHCRPPAHLQEDASSESPVPEIAFESDPANKITAPPKITNPHPLIKLTVKALAKAKTDESGRVNAGPRGGIKVIVYPGSIDRAMLLLDTLVKGLATRGYTVTVDKDRKVTNITILEEAFEICLEERCKRVEYQPSDKELKKSERLKCRTYPLYSHVSSGNFVIKATALYASWEMITSDREKSRIETNLNKVIALLIKYALSVKNRRLQREREERERRERDEQRQEMRRLIALEKEKIKQLDAEVTNWHRSQRIRQYAAAVKQAAIEKHGTISPGSQGNQWLIWAEQQADRLDPLVDSPYSVIDDEEKYLY